MTKHLVEISVCGDAKGVEEPRGIVLVLFQLLH